MTDVDSLSFVRSAAPVREQVVRHLRHMLVSGRFQPGERLVERELCELVDASRTTVREALRQLESEGIVAMVRGQGPIVAPVSEHDVKDLYELREVLETFAVRLFAERADSDTFARLVEAFRTLEAAHERGEATGIIAAKEGFYGVLFEGASNEAVTAVAEKLRWRVARVRLASVNEPGRIAEGIRELRPVVDALRDRDGARAETAYIEHIRRASAAAVTAASRMQSPLPASR